MKISFPPCAPGGLSLRLQPQFSVAKFFFDTAFFCQGLAEAMSHGNLTQLTWRCKMSVANVGYVSPVPGTNSRGTSNEVSRGQPAGQEVKVKTQVIDSSQTRDLERIGNAFNKKLQFVIDHDSNEVLVKVIDKDTDKVIKVIPPEELQRLHKNLKEAIGLLFNEMA